MGKYWDLFLLNCKNANEYCKNERKQNKPNNEYLKSMMFMFWINQLFPRQNNNKNGNNNNNYYR